ncbi:hypothetical protein D3C84_809950 [compost metagenome]
MLEREVLEFEAATGAYADAGQLRPDRLVLSRWRHILQRGRQVLEEVGLDALRGGRHESNLRRSGRRGLMEEGGQRLDLVSRLHLLDIRHVGRIEQLGADQRQCEGRRGTEHLVDARGCRPLPVGTCDQIAPGCAGRGTAADVTVVIGVAVDQLHRVVTFFGDGRHGDHQRLGA